MKRMRLDVLMAKAANKAEKRKAFEVWYAQVPAYLRIGSSGYERYPMCVKFYVHQLALYRLSGLILASPIMAKKQCNVDEKRKCINWAAEVSQSVSPSFSLPVHPVRPSVTDFAR